MNDNEIIKLAIQSAIKEFVSGILADPGILHRDKLSPGRNDIQNKQKRDHIRELSAANKQKKRIKPKSDNHKDKE